MIAKYNTQSRSKSYLLKFDIQLSVSHLLSKFWMFCNQFLELIFSELEAFRSGISFI